MEVDKQVLLKEYGYSIPLDNRRIIVPNGVVTSNVITNISGQGEIGVELTFGIGYGDDIDQYNDVINSESRGIFSSDDEDDFDSSDGEYDDDY